MSLTDVLHRKRPEAEARATAFDPYNGSALDVTAAASYLGVSVSYLNRLRSVGGGPIFVKLGSRVTYRVSDLDDWQAKHTRTSTSDTGDRG